MVHGVILHGKVDQNSGIIKMSFHILVLGTHNLLRRKVAL